MRPSVYIVQFALAGALALGGATPLHAQSRAVSTPSAVLATPKGRAVGSVHPGVKLRVLETRGAYARVSVDGFVERARLSAQRGSAATRVGKRSVVVREHASSTARSVGSLDAGTTVSVSKATAPKGWVRVSRSGWVLRSALEASAPARTTVAKATAAPKRAASPTKPSAAPKASAGEVEPSAPGRPAPSAPVAAAPAPAAAARSAGAPLADSTLVPTANVALRAAPDARALATVAQGTTLVPLARERGWVRVRLEGWVQEKDVAPADTAVHAGVSAADLRADPHGSRGRVVRWTVQVLARQTADALRRDLAADETYLLARGPAEENALLYLVVPPAMLESTKSISALSEAVITARVRTGKSQLVGVPILDLLTITVRK